MAARDSKSTRNYPNNDIRWSDSTSQSTHVLGTCHSLVFSSSQRLCQLRPAVVPRILSINAWLGFYISIFKSVRARNFDASYDSINDCQEDTDSFLDDDLELCEGYEAQEGRKYIRQVYKTRKECTRYPPSYLLRGIRAIRNGRHAVGGSTAKISNASFLPTIAQALDEPELRAGLCRTRIMYN